MLQFFFNHQTKFRKLKKSGKAYCSDLIFLLSMVFPPSWWFRFPPFIVSFLFREFPLAILFRVGLLMTHSLSFHSSGNIFISLHSWEFRIGNSFLSVHWASTDTSLAGKGRSALPLSNSTVPHLISTGSRGVGGMALLGSRESPHFLPGLLWYHPGGDEEGCLLTPGGSGSPGLPVVFANSSQWGWTWPSLIPSSGRVVLLFADW